MPKKHADPPIYFLGAFGAAHKGVCAAPGCFREDAAAVAYICMTRLLVVHVCEDHMHHVTEWGTPRSHPFTALAETASRQHSLRGRYSAGRSRAPRVA